MEEVLRKKYLSEEEDDDNKSIDEHIDEKKFNSDQIDEKKSKDENEEKKSRDEKFEYYEKKYEYNPNYRKFNGRGRSMQQRNFPYYRNDYNNQKDYNSREYVPRDYSRREEKINDAWNDLKIERENFEKQMMDEKASIRKMYKDLDDHYTNLQKLIFQSVLLKNAFK